MLGGYGWLSNIDVQGSQLFVDDLVGEGRSGLTEAGVACGIERGGSIPNSSNSPFISSYHVDCGAGIGRITKHFLSGVFRTVDLVEQNASFLKAAKETFLVKEVQEGKVQGFFAQGLQEFTPEPNRYDVIWCQWVLSHLTDGLILWAARMQYG
jgi:protein N-terminal methyltransferase